jgi:hypothetical protein
VGGDDHGEAYTVIVWGVGLSHEIPEVAGAEAVMTAEGNMCGADMRGTVALPGSKATSRTNGTRRNLRDLMPPVVAAVIAGHDRKSRRRSCRGGCEESDGCVVPAKPRTMPTTSRRRREWRKGGRSKGWRAATHAPDPEPGSACYRSGEPTGSGYSGLTASTPEPRPTFGKSPVRESRTPGSVGEALSNRRLYPTESRLTRSARPQHQE